MSNVYIRFINPEYINTDKIRYHTISNSQVIRDNLWSMYQLQWPMIEDAKLFIHDDEYVLCVLYHSIMKIKINGNIVDVVDEWSFSDFQLGITETFKIGENKSESFQRALKEELGLYYDNENYDRTGEYADISFRSNSRYQNLTITDVNINELGANPYSMSILKTPDYINSFGEKVKMGVLVHGSERLITKFLNRPEIFLNKSDDAIAGILAIKFKDVKDYFRSCRPPRIGTPYKCKNKRCCVNYFKGRPPRKFVK